MRKPMPTLHLPVMSTRHMVNAAAREMKKGADRKCSARRIVDEAALCNALDDGTVIGAAFDVFEKEPISPEHPLLGYEQVFNAAPRSIDGTRSKKSPRKWQEA